MSAIPYKTKKKQVSVSGVVFLGGIHVLCGFFFTFLSYVDKIRVCKGQLLLGFDYLFLKLPLVC